MHVKLLIGFLGVLNQRKTRLDESRYGTEHKEATTKQVYFRTPESAIGTRPYRQSHAADLE